MTDASDKRFMTDEETKLDSVESNADVRQITVTYHSRRNLRLCS